MKNAFAFFILLLSITNISAQDLKPDIQINLGTSITSFSREKAHISSYINPTFNFNLSPKFIVSAGIFSITTFHPEYKIYYSEKSDPIRSTNTFLSISGVYVVSPKLSVDGTVIKDFSADPNSKNGYQYIQMGLNYKITPNIQFRASFSQDNRPYGIYPFFNSYNNPYQSGYYSNFR